MRKQVMHTPIVTLGLSRGNLIGTPAKDTGSAMTDNQQRFRWHPDAQLFAGALPVPRTGVRPASRFCAIDAITTADALTALGAALQSGSGFCLYEGIDPSGLSSEPDQFITLSGGSSGQPKGILRRQSSWIDSFDTNARLFGYTAQDRIAVLGRLSHSLALYGVLESLHLGLDAFALDAVPYRKQAAILAARDISILYATPTQLRLLALGTATEGLPHLRLILCGGGALDDSTAQSIQSLCPNAEIRVFYGAAETSFITLSGPDTPHGSVGQAYPEVTIQIRDPDGQKTTQIGDVWVRSPYLFDRYALGHANDTRLHSGFLSVGEMGRIDDDGNLFLLGRKTRMVQIADQTVFPEEIEAHVCASTAVAACAILPRPDPVRGQRLRAVIEGPADPDLAAQVQQICRDRFGPLIAPKQILFHPALPLLASGKIDLPQLAKWVEGQT
jgi:long-chain acyl-CoA synthetase